VTVPDVIGQAKDQATTALQGAGLTAAPTATSTCDTTNNGNVVSQDPRGGTSVTKGTTVTIDVCSASPSLVSVPDVTGDSLAAAAGILQNQGLATAPTTTTNCDPSAFGTVVTEDPPAGSSVPEGSSVSIGICDASSVPVPSPIP